MSKWEEISCEVNFLTDDIKEIDKELDRYKILIADDDKEIHDVTKLVLRDFEFDGSYIKFLDAFNGPEVIECLKQNDDIAVIFFRCRYGK